MRTNYRKATCTLLIWPALIFSFAVQANNECRDVNILQQEVTPTQSCAYDICYAWTSAAGLGKGRWEGGLNLTDVAPPAAPIPEAFVLAGSYQINFVAQNGDVFFGHSVFVAAPEVPNAAAGIHFMAGGTGRFAEATATLVNARHPNPNKARLVGELCGIHDE